MGSPVERVRSPRWFMAGVAVLAIGFVALQFLRANEPLGLDQGLFACFARWVPRGWLPYRDLFDSKPPLYLYLWVAARLFGSDPAVAMWRFEALSLLATMVLTGALARKLWGDAAALASAAFVLIGLWSPGWGGYWARAQAEELLAPFAVGAALAAVGARERPRLAWAAGLLVGLCGVCKIPSMAMAAAWPIAWWAWRGRRDAALMTVRMGLALLVPWTIAVAWFGAHGALRDFYEAVFVYQRHFAALIAPPWGAVLLGFFARVGGELPWMCALALIGLLRRPREVVWLVAWLVTSAAAIVLQRQLADYHFLLVVPPLALAAARGLVELGRLARGSGPMTVRVIALGVLAACVALLPRTVNAWARTYRPVPRQGVDRARALVDFQRGIISPLIEEELARYLREHTTADEGVLVWGLAPGTYALADRHPTTRFPFHKVLLTEAPLARAIPGLDERRAAFIERLDRDPPRYLVVGRGDANPFDPRDSFSGLDRFAPLRERLEHDYLRETELGRFVLFRRR